MARPRVFISSTFYDLKQVRSDLERFINDMGYDPVLHERGDYSVRKQRKTRRLWLSRNTTKSKYLSRSSGAATAHNRSIIRSCCKPFGRASPKRAFAQSVEQ